MHKEIALAALVLGALLATASLTYAEADLKFRVTVFARAAVAEAMRSSKTGADCSMSQHIQDFDRQLATLEKDVKMFSSDNHSRKEQMITEFKRSLMEKCCRRMGRGG
jgi:hypothetical protein